MKFPFTGFLLLLLSACATPPGDELTQVATLDGLLAGVYDGEVTLEEISTSGDFGLGTYQAVDGEMIYLDGTFYQVKEDGSVVVPASDTRTPFALVVDFRPTLYAELPGMNLEALTARLDELIPDQNQFAAIRIDGRFSSVRTRSVGPQKKPYPPLAEVVKAQTEFLLENVEGTLVGFRCPPFVKGLNVPGYHFHFITRDRDAGGHVLNLEMEKGLFSADTEHSRFTILLSGKRSPSGPAAAEAYAPFTSGPDGEN